MDLITSLSKSRRQHDSMQVVIDRMKKSAHISAGKYYPLGRRLCQFIYGGGGKTSWNPILYYIIQRCIIYGTILEIFSKRLGFKGELEYYLSSLDRWQAEHTIQTIEDMLRA